MPSVKVPVAVFLMEVPAGVPSAKTGATSWNVLPIARVAASRCRNRKCGQVFISGRKSIENQEAKMLQINSQVAALAVAHRK